MLYQELPRIDSTPLDGWGPWLAPLIAGAAAVTAAVVLLLTGQLVLAGLAVAAGVIGATILLRPSAARDLPPETLASGPDYSLVGAALGVSRDPLALTDQEGSLLIVNSAYRERFGNTPAVQLAASEEGRNGLELAQSMALRDGAGCVAGVETTAGNSRVEVERVGARDDLLLWRFPAPPAADPLNLAVRRI